MTKTGNITKPGRLSYTFRMMKLIAIYFTIILISFSVVSCDSQQKLTIVKSSKGYQFYENKKPVLFYQVIHKTTDEGTHARANYCHPVYGLDGQIMTEDFPADHFHHRGIFWAWHQVYIGDVQIIDMWDCTDFTWDIHKVEVFEPNENSVGLQARVFWKSSQWKNGSEPFAEEIVKINLHESVSETRVIDFDIEIIALEDGLRIGGADNEKGYGGFSTRIPLPADIEMNDKNGSVTPERIAVSAGEWMNFTGTFGEKKSAFAIFVHPSNPGLPRQWILRKSGSAQNVAYPGREPIPISMNKSLKLKYRVIIHNNADLNHLFEEYCNDNDLI